MVLELDLVGGPWFKTSFCNLFPIWRFESPWRTLFGLFDSLRAGMRPHVREGVKGMIFILNLNPTNLSF